MKNKNSRIIFRVKDGVAPSEVLPTATLAGEGNEFEIKRLYDIGNEVASFRSHAPMSADIKSDDELFDKEIYATKSEPEQKLFRTYVAEGKPETTESLYQSLEGNENVEYVQYDEMNDLKLKPNDPLLPELWGITKIHCPTAWDSSQGDEIVVAVIDTGVDYNHPDIKTNMWKTKVRVDSGAEKEVYGKDFSDGDDDPMDYHGHGTHCAGTIAATINNSIGIVGVAPKAKIMAVKIFPKAFDSVCAAAIKYAADNGARVLSNSWGPSSRKPSNPAVEDAIDYANAKGCIVVFAAGNDDDDVQFYSPANRPNVISVAATDANDARAGFSNYGSLTTIAAPGVDILSLKFNTTQYTSKSGTSMACPHVAGLVALLLRINKTLTLSQIKQNLRDNADAIHTDKPISSRRINAKKSLQALIAPRAGNGEGEDGTILSTLKPEKEKI